MAEQSTTVTSVYNARPSVRVEQQAYAKIDQLLLAMEMTEREGGLSALDLRLSNVASQPGGAWDLAFEDESILALGKTITVYAGDQAAPQEIFRGKITGVEAYWPTEGPPELVVLAEDVFQQARMARRTKIHENVTPAQVAQDLAGQIGLTPVVTGLSDNIGTQVQLNESDLAFLRRILARCDADLQVVGTEMHVAARTDMNRGTLELHRNPGQLRQARVIADLAHQVTQVTVGGWDPSQGQRVTGRSTGANLGPGSGRQGSALLNNSIGDRAQHIGHLAVTTNDEAQAVADAAFDERARRFVRMVGVSEGNPNLRVGTNVTIQGLGSRFDNTYTVTSACHRYDLMRGYETTFEAECAYWGAP